MFGSELTQEEGVNSETPRSYRNPDPTGPPIATGAALCVSRSPGGGRVATAHLDGTTRVLDAATFETVSVWSFGAAQTVCDWAGHSVRLLETEEEEEEEVNATDSSKKSTGSSQKSSDSSRKSTDGSSDDTKRTSKESKEFNLLATGGADGAVRVFRVAVTGDKNAWRDVDEGVVAAIGPGVGGARKALPASLLTGVSSERVSLALETFGGENSTRKGGSVPFSVFMHGESGMKALGASDTNSDHTHSSFADLNLADVVGLPADALAFAFGPEAEREATAKLQRWQEEYDVAEKETTRASETRREIVRDQFPTMSPSEKRAANKSHAEKMVPLRLARVRLWNLIKTGGYGVETTSEGEGTCGVETHEEDQRLNHFC